MGDVGQLPPAYRVPPSKPASGSGGGQKAPRRKPATGDRDSDPRQQRRKKPGDEPHIDEYA